MPLLSGHLLNIITGGISFLLTLMVLSYLIGDNPVFRLAVYIFIGVSAGYAAAVAYNQVVFPLLIVPLVSGNLSERLLAVIPLVLGILLLFKLSPRTARVGNASMGFLVGVGAAIAIGGGIMGTIFPQTRASMNGFNLSAAGQFWLEKISEGLVMLIGTVATLIYFHYGAKATPTGPQRGKLTAILGWVGQVFIAITFGVLFAGVFMAAITALIERLNFIITFLSSLAFP